MTTCHDAVAADLDSLRHNLHEVAFSLQLTLGDQVEASFGDIQDVVKGEGAVFSLTVHRGEGDCTGASRG